MRRRKKFLEDIAQKPRKAPWYKTTNWGDVIGGFLIFLVAAAALCGFIWLLYWAFTLPQQYELDQDHYSKDFKTYCAQLHGKADIDAGEHSYSALCLDKDNKLLMISSKDDDGTPHYDKDFTTFCEARGGKAYTSGRDLCSKAGYIIMRESKH